jgi:RNA polymerase sigma factor for flagellar operon FliA
MSDAVNAREECIRRLFPLVKKIAHRVQRILPGSELGDLIGDGCVGLVRAVDTYDAGRGPTIERYASRIVAGAMLNGLRRLDPVSERVRRELREAERERYALAAQLGAMPSQLEMESRRPALRRATLHAYRYTPLSLDAALPAGERLAPSGADPASVAARAGERRALQAALHTLPVRQRRVLSLHYVHGQSLRQVGKTLEISPQRASQLHQAALKKLRRVMHAAH